MVQQSQGRVQATTQASGVGLNSDSALEREADELGARAARGEQVARRSTHTIAPASAVAQRVVQCATVDATREDTVTLFSDEGQAPIDPFTRVQILGDGPPIDGEPSKQVKVLTGRSQEVQGLVRNRDLMQLEDTVESDDLAQRIFDDLLTLSVQPTGVDDSDSPIPHYYPKKGCEARAYWYQTYLNRCGYAPEKAFIIALDRDRPLRARSMAAEPDKDELVWYYHVAPIIKVAERGPMVFDPSLFGGPVTAATWISALTPGEVKEYESWDAFKSAHEPDDSDEESSDLDEDVEYDDGQNDDPMLEEPIDNVEFTEKVDDSLLSGIDLDELDDFVTVSSDDEVDDEPSFEYFTTAEPISEPNPMLPNNNDHIKVANGDYRQTLREGIEKGASNVVASNIRHWSSLHEAPFERHWLAIIKAVNRLKWNHDFINRYAIGNDEPYYYVNRFANEYAQLRALIEKRTNRGRKPPVIRDSRKREEILSRLSKALELKR